jgi:cytochrome c oxidase subunit II
MLIFEAENVSQSIAMVEFMEKRRAALRSVSLGLVGTLGATGAALAQKVNDLPGGPAVNQLNFAPAVTKIAEAQHWLHWFMMAICLVIFVIVFGVMFYSILRHRKSAGHKSQVLAEPLWVELGWTIVPLLIVIGMALPATKVLVAQKDTTNSDLTIKATGMQWKWGYDYIKGEGEGIGFLSTLDNSHRLMSSSGNPPPTDDYLLKVDNPLVVPVDKKIRIITTANDVIHAWMVPAFGVKQDAIPGFVRDTWFRAEKTGDYYGQCAELCGKEHAYMPIHVKVVTADEYTAWVDGQKRAMAAAADDPTKVWNLADLVQRGESVYAANCLACHGAQGKGAGPIKPLDGSALVVDADKSKMINVMLNGVVGPAAAMPAWKQLSDTELAAVMTYTKNNWSNQTQRMVQPAEVLAARQ